MLDVIVVGGGPVGSQVAYELASLGHKVAVLEQRERLGEVCCTGVVSLECVQNFAIPEELILRRVAGARLFSPSGNTFCLEVAKPIACILDRKGLDEFLARRARESGAEYFWGSQVKSLEVTPSGVKVGASQNGKLEARAVVLATGASSSFLARLGMGRTREPVMGAQAEVFAPGLDEVQVYSGDRFAPGFFAWLVPTHGGRGLAGLISRQCSGGYLNDFLEWLYQEKKITSANRVKTRPIMLSSLSKSYGERLLVVGGAAGQVKPTTGGGIYYGLTAADIASRNLSQALVKDDLSLASLQGYEREWKKKLGQELTVGRLARKLYENLSDHQIDSMFGLVKTNFIPDLLGDGELTFDWHAKIILRILKQKLGIRMLNRAKTLLQVKESKAL
ncbi:MAG: NAD(P)/FAD-dependent oxidoreductase [Chloroflexota bacterium]